MKTFSPGPEHAAEFRAALGSFPTGVTIVTAALQTERRSIPVGMTVNSFTSVSLEPPLILWCPARVSARHDAFVSATHFAIHILSEDQHALAHQFAQAGDVFAGVEHHLDGHGVPLLDGCVARFDCTTEQVMPGGDHSIILGRVQRVSQDSAPSLAFCGGRFGAFSERR